LSRTRRLAWILSALLTLGTLQATPVSRGAPFAQVRSAASLVLADLLREESPASEIWARPEYPDQPAFDYSADPDLPSAWLGSLFHFQRPPPALATQRSSLVA
jgi:hypothetical protein